MGPMQIRRNTYLLVTFIVHLLGNRWRRLRNSAAPTRGCVKSQEALRGICCTARYLLLVGSLSNPQQLAHHQVAPKECEELTRHPPDVTGWKRSILLSLREHLFQRGATGASASGMERLRYLRRARRLGYCQPVNGDDLRPAHLAQQHRSEQPQCGRKHLAVPGRRQLWSQSHALGAIGNSGGKNRLLVAEQRIKLALGNPGARGDCKRTGLGIPALEERSHGGA